MGGGASRIALRIATGVTLAFIYIPIGVIVLTSFNAGSVPTWPPEGLTLDWYVKAFNDEGVRSSFLSSVQAALGATALALVLGSLLAFAVHRFRFFGRETVSFLVILPHRPAWDRDRDRAEHGVPDDRPRIRPPDDHHRPRHVLHRGRLQQRDRPAATHARSIEEASMDLGADTVRRHSGT